MLATLRAPGFPKRRACARTWGNRRGFHGGVAPRQAHTPKRGRPSQRHSCSRFGVGRPLRARIQNLVFVPVRYVLIGQLVAKGTGHFVGSSSRARASSVVGKTEIRFRATRRFRDLGYVHVKVRRVGEGLAHVTLCGRSCEARGKLGEAERREVVTSASVVTAEVRSPGREPRGPGAAGRGGTRGQ